MGRPPIHSKITFICINCGVEKTVYHNPNQSFKFCSKTCRYDYKRKVTTTKLCKHCNRQFTVALSVESRYAFCSKECKISYSGNINNHRRGGSWESCRSQALYRDNNRCRLCANTAETVHHIIPFRNFVSGKEANKLGNIISLCGTCHKTTYGREMEFANLFFRILTGDKI